MGGTQAVRVFADNARWWLVSVSPNVERDVTVEAVDRDGSRRPLPQLSRAELQPLDQLVMPVPASRVQDGRTRLEVSWRHDDQHYAYCVDVANDGLHHRA
jgi:hypothetical protein